MYVSNDQISLETSLKIDLVSRIQIEHIIFPFKNNRHFSFV